MILKRNYIIYITAAAGLMLLAFFIYHFREKIIKVAIPFLMALIIAYLLNPLVLRLERKNIRRSTGILLIYLILSLLTVLVTLFIVPEFINNTRDLMNTLPDITSRYRNMIDGFMLSIQSSRWPPDIKNAIFKEINNGTAAAQSIVMDILKRSLSTFIETVTMLLDFVLAMVIAYYFIKDADFFKNAFLSFIPRKWRNNLINTGREINSIMSNFIQGQLLTALIVGVMEGIGLFVVKIKYPLVLGLIGGIANIIPYFGPVIGAIPALVVALIDSPARVLWTLTVFIVVQQIDNSYISPKIIEGRLGLHPVTTILAVLAGGEFFGIIGMLVSVPVVAILKVVIKRAVDAIV